MLPNVGWPELILLFAIALLLFGPQRLAGIGSTLGKTIREFRRSLHDIEEESREGRNSPRTKP